jgi:trimethylamine--corrinoid protein Co-methyltransferase
MATTAREGRRGGRAARREARTGPQRRWLPVLERAVPVYEILDPERLEAIHRASLDILEQVGIDFRDDEASRMWRTAGAEVERYRVRIPGELLMALVAKNPTRFVVHARNPERSTEIGGNKVAFAPTYGSPFVYDFNNERRYGTLADLHQFHKLAYLAPTMHNTGSVVCEPVDVPVATRHLHITYSALKHSDKPFMGPVTAPERAEDAVRMAKLVFGDAFIDANSVMISLVNCNSPLVWDETMLGALKVYARANQAVIIAPFRAGGREHAGLSHGRARPAQCRGAGRNRVRPAVPARRANDLRSFPRRGLNEVGGADGRHARARVHELRDRPAGPEV